MTPVLSGRGGVALPELRRGLKKMPHTDLGTWRRQTLSLKGFHTPLFR